MWYVCVSHSDLNIAQAPFFCFLLLASRELGDISFKYEGGGDANFSSVAVEAKSNF